MKCGWILFASALWVGCPGGSSIVDRDASRYKYDTGLILVDGKPADSAAPPSDLSRIPDQLVPPDQQPPDSKPSAGDIGDPCVVNADCIYGVCALNVHTGMRFCTKICDPCTNPCPAGSGCQDAGQAFICAPDYPNAPCQ